LHVSCYVIPCAKCCVMDKNMDNKNDYKVKFTKFSDGERYPLLVNGKGIPHWHVTLFTTTQIRNANKAPNTIAAALSAIKVLLDWTHSFEIDLEARFAQCSFLNEQELESLRCYTQSKSSKKIKKILKVIPFPRASERSRSAIEKNTNKISFSTQYIRMTYQNEYLEWLAIRIIEQEAKCIDEATLKRIKSMSKSFATRRPQKSISSREAARKGLTEEQQSLLLSIIEPSSKKNPFSPALQIRNKAAILLLYHLGIRAGELLALRTSDFDFQQNTVLIARRHDNPDDPRTYQPVVKTADRRIPLASSLINLVSDYVLRERRKIPKSKLHDFLFITHQSGAFKGQPLSIKGLNKVFLTIQRAEPESLGNLTPHLLRHTANDRFSELMDKRNATPAEEEKMRSYIMGWKEGSGTAATYTRRHIEKKAKEAALKLQEGNQITGRLND
jgi:integrase